MINPLAYVEFIHTLDEQMERARVLGLFRTAEKVHAALNEARSEQFEAAPREPVSVDFKIGPVREQNL